MTTEDADQAGERSTVRAVDRALDILVCFAESESRLGLSEIARRVGLHKSTVHRLLATLERRGFVSRQPNMDEYRLGFRILELASRVHETDDLATVALPEMRRLRDELGETVSLYIRMEHERLRIQAIEGTEAVRRAAHVGRRFPLYAGASGKVLLAYLSDAEWAELERAGAFPTELPTEQLRLQLSEIRELGYAVSIQEREVGAAAVSAPIFNRAGRAIAALSVAGPVDRYHAGNVERFTQACKRSADAISLQVP